MVDSLDSLQAFMGLVQMGRLMWCTVAGGASGDVAVDSWAKCAHFVKNKGELVHQSLGEELWILEIHVSMNFHALQNITLADLLLMLPFDVAISAGSKTGGKYRLSIVTRDSLPHAWDLGWFGRFLLRPINGIAVGSMSLARGIDSSSATGSRRSPDLRGFNLQAIRIAPRKIWEVSPRRSKFLIGPDFLKR